MKEKTMNALAILLVACSAVMLTFLVFSLTKADSDCVVNDNLSVTGIIERNGNTVWDAGNDGSGSGLDADTVDGYHAADLLAAGGGCFQARTWQAGGAVACASFAMSCPTGYTATEIGCGIVGAYSTSGGSTYIHYARFYWCCK